MVLKPSALQRRAKKLELRELLKNKPNPPCLLVLDKLLHDVYIVGRPLPKQYSQRGDLVRIFNEMAKEVYGNCNDFPVVEAFGSFLMNMFSNGSDLDLSINFSSESAELPRDKKIKALRKLSKKLYLLQSKGHVLGVTPILWAKVPILKVTDRGTRIECDISVENKDGILKSQFILIVSEIDERFQKLSSLMKAWAKAYGINSSKDNTLNSLSIILLVALHLQTREPPILPPFSALLKDGSNPGNVKNAVRDFLQYGKENKESVAELFTTMLSKLASVETLWPEGLCASTYEGSWISKTWEWKVGRISVEDFVDRSQNVARAVGKNAVKTIYKSINSSLHHLSAFMGGVIDAPKLKTHLFGAEQVPLSENTKNLKRNLPVDTVMAKKARMTTNSNPWEDDQTHQPRQAEGWGSGVRGAQQHEPTEFMKSYGFQSCPPPITAPIPSDTHSFGIRGFGHGFQHGTTEFWGSGASQNIPFPASKFTGLQNSVKTDVAWKPTSASGSGGPYNPWSTHSPSDIPEFGHGFRHGSTASQGPPCLASQYTCLQNSGNSMYPTSTPNAGGPYNPRSTQPPFPLQNPTCHPHGWAC